MDVKVLSFQKTCLTECYIITYYIIINYVFMHLYVGKILLFLTVFIRQTNFLQ